ncbi:hypothetical protein EBR43_01080 [bacterium]|jgi:hypothetical protein|nr:hypothetical protein [bacterium]NBX72006.1 hypothetical protein [bacterium]
MLISLKPIVKALRLVYLFMVSLSIGATPRPAYLFEIFFIRTDHTADRAMLPPLKIKYFHHKASVWALGPKKTPKIITKNFPQHSVKDAFAFTIPSFEHSACLSLEAYHDIVNRPTYHPFNIIDNNKPFTLCYKNTLNKTTLGHVEILSATNQELKISLRLMKGDYQLQLNERLPINKWIIVDNPYVTSVVRITLLNS